MSDPVVQFLGKGPSKLRGPRPSSGRKEWCIQNGKWVPEPVSDRLTVCRQNPVADSSTRVDLRGTACQKRRREKIRLRLGGLNNVWQNNMSHPKPFHRNYRPMIDGPNSAYTDWSYIVDRQYAKSPEHYVRAFLLIQSDIQRLFEFIEPSDTNLSVFSYRIHELFMRTCIEIEANFKAILSENIFTPLDKNGAPRPEKLWKIHDYKKTNITHHLSGYKVHIPIWEGANSTFTPFKEWDIQQELSWYQAYNKSKHDRQSSFKEANLNNLLNAVSGLVALLSAQFRTQDFSPGSTVLSVSTDSYYTTEPALGGFFHIEFPSNWTDAEKYDFDWSVLKKASDRFLKIDYNVI